MICVFPLREYVVYPREAMVLLSRSVNAAHPLWVRSVGFAFTGKGLLILRERPKKQT
jgi:hypothetical protein